MNRSKNFSLLALALATWGCAAQVEPQEAEPAVAAQAELLAEVKLSDTHTIRFLNYHGASYSIQELFNLDRDVGDGQPSYADMKKDDVHMVETYMYFTKGAADPAVIERLRAADERIAALPPAPTEHTTPVVPDEMVGGQSASSDGIAPSTAPTIENTSPDVHAAVAGSACAEPNEDWQSDDGWFKNTFCRSDSRFCATEYLWASYGWYRGPNYFEVAALAQSFCSGAQFLLQDKIYGGFPFYGIAQETLVNINLSPRTGYHQTWHNGGDVAWYTKVTSNTGANRVALAIHH